MNTRRIYLTDDQRVLSADGIAAVVELIIDLKGHLKGIHHGGRVNQEEEKFTLARVDPILTLLSGE